MNITSLIIEEKIVAVVRADDHLTATNLAKAIIAGGIKVIEITFTVPNAEEVIKELSINNDCIVGAGTIMNQALAEIAINNGAKFIVSPNFNKDVLDVCNKYNTPYYPGCMTVQEITNALDYGVEIIKLFPASFLGPKYLKSLRGPLPDIKIMPTGGVNLDNMEEWFKAGAIAVGVGGELTSIGKSQGLDALTEASKIYVKASKI